MEITDKLNYKGLVFQSTKAYPNRKPFRAKPHGLDRETYKVITNLSLSLRFNQLAYQLLKHSDSLLRDSNNFPKILCHQYSTIWNYVKK